MSTFSDIVDGTRPDIDHLRRGLVYTCLCGWLDLGHARPDAAARLWNAVNTETGEGKVGGRWYRVDFGESMSRMKLTVGESRSFAVLRGLSHKQKEAVALGIFLGVSDRFENMQSSFPWSWGTDSGYSAEDLASNLVGFYRAVRPGTPYIRHCGPVSMAAAQKIWSTYGAVGTLKNHSAVPFLFPCSECGSNVGGPMCGRLPTFLSMIQPAAEGELYKSWDPQLMLEDQSQPLQLNITYYVVRPGESLSKIAAQVYGNVFLWPLIYDSNRREVGPNPNLIHPGQRLLIPELKKFNRQQLDDAQRRGRSAPIAPLR